MWQMQTQVLLLLDGEEFFFEPLPEKDTVEPNDAIIEHDYQSTSNVMRNDSEISAIRLAFRYAEYIRSSITTTTAFNEDVDFNH